MLVYESQHITISSPEPKFVSGHGLSDMGLSDMGLSDMGLSESPQA